MRYPFSTFVAVLAASVLQTPLLHASDAGQVKALLDTHNQTQKAGQRSQAKVSRLDDETQTLLAKYQRLLQQRDYQKAYNQELILREEQQQVEIANLQRQIEDARITEQKLLPVLRRMVDTLAKFIQLDLPFEREERLESMERLKSLLADTSVPIAEKYRRVMEAYQAENDLNYDMQTYRAVIEVDGAERSVALLRMGRTALYFQTLDGEQSGIWQREDNSWQALDSQYNAMIRRAMRVADKTLAPELMPMPVPLPSEPVKGGAS